LRKKTAAESPRRPSPLRQPQDHVAVGLARAAQGARAVENAAAGRASACRITATGGRGDPRILADLMTLEQKAEGLRQLQARLASDEASRLRRPSGGTEETGSGNCMRLLDEIIDLAVEDKTSLPVLLRKCLVLAHRLKNERLKAWAEKELDGYRDDDALPVYRETNTISKGVFFGAFGSKIENQPIPTAMLKKEHRAIVEKAYFRSPIAAYQLGSKEKGDHGDAALDVAKAQMTAELTRLVSQFLGLA
jgi:hypothetical protein